MKLESADEEARRRKFVEASLKEGRKYRNPNREIKK
jgi:hypothetical protein